MNRFRCTDLALVEALPMRFYPKLRAGHVLNNASAKFERHSQHNPKGLMPLGAYSYSIPCLMRVGLGDIARSAKMSASWGPAIRITG